MAENKNSSWLLLLLALFLFKKKKGTSVVIDPYETTKSSDADYWVEVMPMETGSYFGVIYDINTNVGSKIDVGTKLDGFRGYLPTYMKVRFGGKFYLLNKYKIIG